MYSDVHNYYIVRCSYATLDLDILRDMHVPIGELRGTVLCRGH